MKHLFLLFAFASASSEAALASASEAGSYPTSDQNSFRPVLNTVIGNGLPKTMSINFWALDRNISLSLVQNSLFVPPKYLEFIPDSTIANSTKFTVNGLNSTIGACYYQGTVDNDPSAFVAVNLCKGIHGTLVTQGKVFEIEPDQATLAGFVELDMIPAILHHISLREGLQLSNYSFCDHQDSDEEKSGAKSFYTNSQTPALANFNSGEAKVIQALIVNDFSRYQGLGAYTESASLDILNLVDAYYKYGSFRTSIRVEVVGQITNNLYDPYDIKTIGGKVDPSGSPGLLGRFNDYLQRYSPYLPEHDVAVLLSGLTFRNGMLGLATVGSCCDPTSRGLVTSMITGGLSEQAIVVAHEIGHTIGMSHDGTGNLCSPSGDIMAAYAELEVNIGTVDVEHPFVHIEPTRLYKNK